MPPLSSSPQLLLKLFNAFHLSGIFFQNKVDYATWFGWRYDFIHGIQMLPVTPALLMIRTPEFCRQEPCEFCRWVCIHGSTWIHQIFSKIDGSTGIMVSDGFIGCVCLRPCLPLLPSSPWMLCPLSRCLVSLLFSILVFCLGHSIRPCLSAGCM